MPKRKNPDGYYWRAKRKYDVCLIRGAIEETGSINAAAKKLQVNKSYLQRTVAHFLELGEDVLPIEQLKKYREAQVEIVARAAAKKASAAAAANGHDHEAVGPGETIKETPA